MAERLLARGGGFQQALGLTFLAAAGALLQRNVHFQHQGPGVDAIADLHRLHADDEIREAVAVGQVAAFFRAVEAGGFDGQLRIAGEQALVQDLMVEARRNRAQGAGRRQRRVDAAGQRGVDEGAQVVIFGFHADQLGVHRAALDLRADGVLLRRQSAGITYLGDLLELAAEGDVLARQLYGPVGQPVLRVKGLDAGGDLGPGIGGAAAGLLGLGGGDLALQIALAPERQRLRQQVLGIASARRRQRRVLGPVARDVLQLDAQERIGQGAGRADPLARRFRLQLPQAQVRAALAGDGEQRFHAGARRRFAVGGRRQAQQQRGDERFHLAIS